MNNNDPMKRFGYIVFSICLFALSACTPHEQMDQEEGIVKVSMGLTAASFTDDEVRIMALSRMLSGMPSACMRWMAASSWADGEKK